MTTIRNDMLPGIAFALVLILLPLSPAVRAADDVAIESAPVPAVAPETPLPAEPQTAVGSTDSAVPPVLASDASIRLSLADTIRTALRTNLEIRILGYQPYIAASALDAQNSVFDPSVAAALSYSSRKSPTLESTSYSKIGLTPNASHTWSDSEVEAMGYETALSVRSSLGGTFSVSTAVAKNDVSATTASKGTSTDSSSIQHENYHDGNIQLRLAQPLLKNAGALVNKAGVRIAANDAKSSTYVFEGRVMDLVLKTSTVYWNLVLFREDLKAREKSLQAAQDLLKNNTVKYDAGALPRIEVTRARARVAEREAEIVVGKAVIKEAEDRLRGILDSVDFPLLSTAEIVPEDRPTVYAEQLDVSSAVSLALAIRPDIKEQVLNVENAGIRLARSRRQLLPQVDVAATYRLNSFGDSWLENFNSARTIDKRDLTLGLSAFFPLGNRLARSEHARSRYQRIQELAALELFQRNATLEVKKAVRDVATSLQRIDTNQLRRQYAQENLEAEIQKYDVGQSISLDVLDAQEALQQAESAYNQSVVGFNQAMNAYYRTTGQILQRYGIEVVPLATINTASQTLSQ